MKKIRSTYPRRRALLTTPFRPLSDDEFRQLVLARQAIPIRRGGLLVAKWSDGPPLDADEFLVALRAEGSRMEVRKFKSDANVRIIRRMPSRGGPRRPSVVSRPIPA
jgi:hypothetical protein